MGHGNNIVIPDWREYKIDGIKELENLQKALQSQGLKDPWIRNEVWRYHPQTYIGPGRAGLYSIFKGFKWAVAAMVLTVGAEKLLFNKQSDTHHTTEEE
ncbi:NADH dehydrogenase [ubiquinone] 1 beta subcomplex subunit 3-like [Gigantopelta aegis]|uniref:NADH dehydrogenase [ubiquinone] 1 beta subcomplex subunit 3-like n=1 Tax=Gigantopelta aegis TaxID=1735272 RepID=UPI001B88BB6B|nr:NADH dehydrogenase [ubiquinone] 1 beta subcomplex subunit 3-like [Gigantopelta aegis]